MKVYFKSIEIPTFGTPMWVRMIIAFLFFNAIIIGVTYFAYGFAEWQWQIAKWPKDRRGTLICVSLFVSFWATIISASINSCRFLTKKY